MWDRGYQGLAPPPSSRQHLCQSFTQEGKDNRLDKGGRGKASKQAQEGKDTATRIDNRLDKGGKGKASRVDNRLDKAGRGKASKQAQEGKDKDTGINNRLDRAGKNKDSRMAIRDQLSNLLFPLGGVTGHLHQISLGGDPLAFKPHKTKLSLERMLPKISTKLWIISN